MNIKTIFSFNNAMAGIRDMGIMNEFILSVIVILLIVLNNKGVI